LADQAHFSSGVAKGFRGTVRRVADVFDLAPREIRESGISLAMKTTKREQAEFYLLNVGVHYLDRISEEFLPLVTVSRVALRE